MREVARSPLNRHAALLDLEGVDVAVEVSPWGLSETGIGGYAPLDHLVQISVNPHADSALVRHHRDSAGRGSMPQSQHLCPAPFGRVESTV